MSDTLRKRGGDDPVQAASAPAQPVSAPAKMAPPQLSRLGVAWEIFVVLASCCLNVFTLELITKRDPKSGHLITFSQFVFVSAFLFPGYWQWPIGGFKKRTIPVRWYLGMTLLFFVLSTVNNKALAYKISVPLHTIFRSCSLASSLVVGMLFFGKRYSRNQIAACVLVTIGIIIATLADALTVTFRLKDCCPDDANADLSKLPTSREEGGPTESLGLSKDAWAVIMENIDWFWGIAMLTFALVLSALLGHVQSSLYKKFGDDWRENLFYSHLLSLPGFILVADELWHHFLAWRDIPPVYIGGLDFGFSIYFILFLNVSLQYVCIRGVFILTSTVGTLSCTFTITIRKFLSLILSVMYFKNPFTFYHWVGSILVFGGAFLYVVPSGDTKVTPAPTAEPSASGSQGAHEKRE